MVPLGKRIQRLQKQAKFRFPSADVYTLVYEGRPITKQQILELATCSFTRMSTISSRFNSRSLRIVSSSIMVRSSVILCTAQIAKTAVLFFRGIFHFAFEIQLVLIGR